MTSFQSPDMYQIREIWDWNFSCLRLRQSFFSWGKVKFKKLIATAWNCLTQRKTCLRDYRSSLRKWFLDYLQADFDALQEFVTGLNMNLTKGTKKSNFSLHLKHWSSTSSADEVLEHEIISFCMRKKMAKSLKLLISIIISFNVSVTTGIPGRMVMSSDVITYDAIWQRWPDDDVRIELVYIF